MLQGGTVGAHHPEHPGRAALAGRVADHVHDRLHVPRARAATRRAGARGARPRRRGVRSACRARRRRSAPRRATAASPCSYSPAAGNGATGGELRYEYSLNGGGWTRACPAATSSAASTTARATTVALRAYTAARRRALRRARLGAVGAAQIPYGPVGNPGASASRQRTRHHLRVERAGAERPARSPRCRSASTAAAGRTSRTAARAPTRYAYSTTHTIDVRAQDAAGQWSRRRVGVGHDRRSAAAAGVGRLRAAPRSGNANCSTSSCAYFVAEHPGLPGGHLPRRTARAAPDGEFAGGAQRSMPANGSVQLGCYYGKPDTQVWVAHRGLGRVRAHDVALTHAFDDEEGQLRMTMTPEQAAWFQGTFSRLVDNVDQAVMGKREVVGLVLAAMLAEGHVLLEDAPGHRQDQPREGARRHRAGHEQPHPVHARPAALRRHGRHDLRPGAAPVRVPPRARLRLDRARRRDQPRIAEDPVRAARGHGGVAGDRRRHAARGRPAVPRDRDAEPDRAGGHLQAARGAARPLPHQDLDRLPRPRRRRAHPRRRSRPQPLGAPVRAHHHRRGRRHGRPRARRSTSSPPSCATPRSSPRRRATTPRPASASRCAARSR